MMDHEMTHRIIAMLEHTWQAIGHDCLETSEDGSMDQEEVIEMVCDADHYLTYGEDKEAAEEFAGLLRNNRAMADKICKAAFPSGSYGY